MIAFPAGTRVWLAGGMTDRGLIRRHTMRARLNAKLRQVKATLRRNRHMPIPEQGRYLRLVLNGFYNSTPSRPTSALSIPSTGTSCVTGSTAFGGAASGTG